MCCCLGFRPPAESLDSHRSPVGPPCGCCFASLRIALPAGKVAKEKARPTSGAVRLAARLPSHWWPGSAPSHDGAPRSLRCSPGVHASRPLRNTSARPPDGIEVRVACKNEKWLWRCILCTTCHASFRRVSAVVVSGRAVWARREDQACSCTPFPEGGWNAGSDGETSVLACFLGAGHPARRKVNRPAGRNQAFEPLAERLETEGPASSPEALLRRADV